VLKDTTSLCVFMITGGPVKKLCAGGRGENGGHVLNKLSHGVTAPFLLYREREQERRRGRERERERELAQG